MMENDTTAARGVFEALRLAIAGGLAFPGSRPDSGICANCDDAVNVKNGRCRFCGSDSIFYRASEHAALRTRDDVQPITPDALRAAGAL